MTDRKIIAFGLLTERDLQVLGPTFSRAWPVDEAPCFTQLLEAIDKAEAVTRNSGASDRRIAAPAGTNVTPRPIGGGRR